MDFENLIELEQLAAPQMTQMAYDYVSGGAGDELTLRDNRAAWQRWQLRPRVLRDVSRVNLATTVLGQPIRYPVIVAPTAFHRLAHDQGELASSRAAAAAGTIFTASTVSTYKIEQIVAQGANTWFQLYCYRDAGVTRQLVKRATAGGCTALVITADTPYVGRRERDVRNGFILPAGVEMMNLQDVNLEDMPRTISGSSLATYIAGLWNPALSWRDLAWIRSLTNLPILIKGIMTAEDALIAVEHGVAGIVVSNHGGRQLDGVPATIDVLAEVVTAVAGRAEVLLDGGVRRGSDVLKALALGAKAVLVGRPIIWGLAVGGEAGALRVLEMLYNELNLALALAGQSDVNSLDANLVVAARH